MSLSIRPRRLRRTPALRDLVRETNVRASDLVLPLFVEAGITEARPVATMPGVSVGSHTHAVTLAREAHNLGVGAVVLFGIPSAKDPSGSAAWDPKGPVPLACRAIKDAVPEMVVIADVCLCEYTAHGHCGVLGHDHASNVRNDQTLELLSRTAVTYAQAGADVVAPSDMMDGRVGAIREALDANAQTDTAILSYAVKYASAFYGPFRDAAQSKPEEGDRRGYQMDPANRREALREALLDVEQGADMLMVKPAMPYLDVLSDVRAATTIPVAAYQVSGEYAMIKAAAAAGMIDERAAMLESLTSIRRAGADFVLTYFAMDAAKVLGR